MKKIIFLTVAIWTALTTVYGQDKEYQYHPWSEFQGDTVAFLTANFSNQTHFFNGKSILDVVDVLEQEMPVKKIAYLTYPETSTLQVIDLIFDERKQWKPFNQLHFYVGNFDKEYALDELKTIFKSTPKEIIPLTDSLRQRLGKFIFQEHAPASIFTAAKLSNLFNMTPETQDQIKGN